MDLVRDIINSILLKLNITTMTKYKVSSKKSRKQVDDIIKYMDNNIQYYVKSYYNRKPAYCFPCEYDTKYNIPSHMIVDDPICVVSLGNNLQNILEKMLVLDLVNDKIIYKIEGYFQNKLHGKCIYICFGMETDIIPYFMGEIHGVRYMASYNHSGDNICLSNEMINIIKTQVNSDFSQIEYKADKKHGICNDHTYSYPYYLINGTIMTYSFFDKNETNKRLWFSLYDESLKFVSETNYLNGKLHGLNFTVCDDKIVNMIYHINDENIHIYNENRCYDLNNFFIDQK